MLQVSNAGVLLDSSFILFHYKSFFFVGKIFCCSPERQFHLVAARWPFYVACDSSLEK